MAVPEGDRSTTIVAMEASGTLRLLCAVTVCGASSAAMANAIAVVVSVFIFFLLRKELNLVYTDDCVGVD
jgi:hypothetical protein